MLKNFEELLRTFSKTILNIKRKVHQKSSSNFSKFLQKFPLIFVVFFEKFNPLEESIIIFLTLAQAQMLQLTVTALAMDALAHTSGQSGTTCIKKLVCAYCSGDHDETICDYNCSQDQDINWKGHLRMVLKQHLKNCNQTGCTK